MRRIAIIHVAGFSDFPPVAAEKVAFEVRLRRFAAYSVSPNDYTRNNCAAKETAATSSCQGIACKRPPHLLPSEVDY